jgi:hypothetical protein
MTQNLDLSKIVGRGEIKVSPEEYPEERAYRLKSEFRFKLLEDIKATILFFVLLGGLISISLICVRLIAFDDGASAETKRWAQTLLAGLITGSVSFLLGRAVGK